MNRQTIGLVLILLLVIAPLTAAKPSERDILIAVTAISDATIANVAAYLNTPALNLPGSIFEKEARATLPKALELKDADLGIYRKTYQSLNKPQSNFLLSLLQSAKGPLNDVALLFLDTHEWEEGQVSLTGRVSTVWGEGVTLASLMTSVVTGGAIDPIEAIVDVTAAGTRLSTDVSISGSFLLFTDQEGYFVIEPRELKVNGE
ncbi:MAG TPA: hypothetical protein PLR03_00530 [Sphaerochaeta sp.]|jgi:hypothetical protein|nr:hypothetical protein [Sphaerochaeta sp.]HPB41291.1 hypothetical protein [Sphaerochaeta sp.]HPY45790.1 hypothetical protein [Sphaerochaeta sp.]HQB04821.1 hypothetical protein [Sphaerochaeta sp.]